MYICSVKEAVRKCVLLLFASLLLTAIYSNKAIADDTGTYSIPADGTDVTPLPSLFTGAMEYNVPIKLPPGRNGLTPNLNLNYNSGNTAGDVGLGWSLEVGAIQRNPAVGQSGNMYLSVSNGGNKAISDSFAIKSPTSSTALNPGANGSGYGGYVYTPIIGNLSFDKIVAFGTGSIPTSWQVTNTRGTTYSYGLNSNSVMSDPHNTANIFRWNLSNVMNTFKDEVLYTYIIDPGGTGQTYISQITYNQPTGSGLTGVVVNFIYSKDANYPSAHYGFTNPVVKSLSLKAITITANNRMLNSYSFSYDSAHSYLKSIKVFGTDGVVDGVGNITGTSSPALTFIYGETNCSIDGNVQQCSVRAPRWIKWVA